MTPALLLSLVLASEQPEEFVPVDRVPLIPRANLAFADGVLRLHPYLGLGAGAGDDPRGGDAASTTWAIGLVGATVRWFVTATDRLEGDAAVRYRRYNDVSPRSDWTGHLRLNARHQGENGWVEGDGGGSREEGTVAVLGGGRSRVDSVFARLAGARLFSAGGTVVRATASNENYDGAGEDRDRLLGTGEIYGFINHGQGRYGLRLRGETTHYQESTRYNSSVGIALLIGTVQKFSERISCAIDVGAILRQYDTGGDDAEVIAPLASMIATWEFSERSSIGVTFTTTLDDNSAGNAETLMKIGPVTRIRLAPDWQFAAQATYGRGFDTGKPTGEAVELRTLLEASAAIEYHFPRDGAAIRLEVSGEDNRAEFAGDSDGLRGQIMYLTVW